MQYSFKRVLLRPQFCPLGELDKVHVRERIMCYAAAE